MSDSERDYGEEMEHTALFEQRRERMVEKQLKSRGISDTRVLQAMGRVPREAFVPRHLQSSAYDDRALPIEHGQTISQPFTVAFMCQAARLQASDTVLEVGTGSGYGAAVLSQGVKQVFSLERVPQLADGAKARLERLGYTNIEVRTADGTLGLPDAGPFDAIVVTAAAAGLPVAYLDQLAEGGRIVIPLGGYSYGQSLYRFTLHAGELLVDDLGEFAFVPLIGKYGWNEDGGSR